MIAGSAILGFGASFLLSEPSYDLNEAEKSVQYYLDDLSASDQGKPSAKEVIGIIESHKAN